MYRALPSVAASRAPVGVAVGGSTTLRCSRCRPFGSHAAAAAAAASPPPSWLRARPRRGGAAWPRGSASESGARGDRLPLRLPLRPAPLPPAPRAVGDADGSAGGAAAMACDGGWDRSGLGGLGRAGDGIAESCASSSARIAMERSRSSRHTCARGEGSGR